MNEMFLLTRPNHDTATTYLYSWADEIIKFADDENIRKRVFSSKDATRSNIEKFILSEKPRLIIFKGHGTESTILGHRNEPLIEINSTNTNVHILKDSIVYAIACSAARRVGPESVRDGAESFIGYSDEFSFIIDPKRETAPEKDKRAEPFKQFSNTICISLLQGKSVGEAVDKAKRVGIKLFRDYSTSESQEINEAIRFLLFRNMEILRFEGNADARFR